MAEEKTRGGFGRAFGLGKGTAAEGEHGDESGASVAIVVADSVSDFAARSSQPADVPGATESANGAEADAAPKKSWFGRKPTA